MLGAIAGDIIGSRFEGHPGPPADFELFHAHCRFTDDTVCTLAVADALLGARDFARTLRAFVRRHPDRGYGGMFLNWAFRDDAPAYGSWGNGAPMRASAVGWLAADEPEAMDLAAAQAAVSHDHPDAVAAAQAVALAILLLRQGVPPRRVRQRLADDFGYDLTPERALRSGGFDVSSAGTMPPALAATFEASDWESAVRTAVCLGGDTDTLACIAGAVAEAIHGVPADVAAQARALLTPDLHDVLARAEAAIRPIAPPGTQ
jgi:ADP-ribosyl-[dinitrogen reductase] hydrolase